MFLLTEEMCIRDSHYPIRKEEVFMMKELKPIKEGKVREIYDNGDSLIMVATDRISCFDAVSYTHLVECGTPGRRWTRLPACSG